jgi:hypothetical protein
MKRSSYKHAWFFAWKVAVADLALCRRSPDSRAGPASDRAADGSALTATVTVM